MVLVEALASGRPLITTKSGAIPEVVGTAAELVEPYQVAHLAHTLEGLLSSERRRNELAAAGRAHALRNYSLPVVAEQLAGVYSSILKAQP